MKNKHCLKLNTQKSSRSGKGRYLKCESYKGRDETDLMYRKYYCLYNSKGGKNF